MAVNKVVYGNNTLIDLSSDTLAAENMLEGVTGHDKAGNHITGTFTLRTELTEQDTLLAQIIAALAKKGAVAGEVATLDEVKAYLNI